MGNKFSLFTALSQPGHAGPSSQKAAPEPSPWAEFLRGTLALVPLARWAGRAESAQEPHSRNSSKVTRQRRAGFSSALHFWGMHTGASPTGIQLHAKGEAAVTSQDLAKGSQCLRACNKVTSVEKWKLGCMLFQVCLLFKFYLKIVHLLFSLAK